METSANDRIREYIELPTPEELANQLAPAQTSAGALKQLAEVRQTLEKKRREIAEILDFDGLYGLLKQLCEKYDLDEGRLLFAPLESGNRLYPPPVAILPALEEWEKRVSRCLELDSAEQDAQLEAEEVRLELGSRWKDGPVDAREWLCVVIGPEVRNLQDPDVLLRAWFDYGYAKDSFKEILEHRPNSELEENLRKARLLAVDAPEASPATNETQEAALAAIEEVIRVAEQDLIQREELRKFSAEYEIGRNPPTFKQAEFDEVFARIWPMGRMVNDGEKVQAVKLWGDFWRNFGQKHLERQRAQLASSKEIRLVRSAAGNEGIKARERKKYLRFSQEFAGWLCNREFTATLINEFPKQEGVAARIGREFLGVMLNAKTSLESHRAMWETLEGVKIMLDQEDAEECFEIIHTKKIVQVGSKGKK